MINFIIPDFCNVDESIYTLDTFHQHPEIFKRNINIIGLTGSFPGCVWNKSNRKFDMYEKIYTEDTLQKMKTRYRSMNISIFIIFDNENIDSSLYDDEYANMIMKVFNDKNNYVICSSNKLIDYIKENYKDINIVDYYDNSNNNSKYSIIDESMNRDSSLFDNKDKSKFILRPDCNFIKDRMWMFKHTKKDSELFNVNPKKDKYYSKKNNKTFYEIRKDENYLRYEDLLEYSNKGINTFLLSGTGMYNHAMYENIIDYLYLDEFKADARKNVYPILVSYKEQEENMIANYQL